jgi:hypothetical protein
MVAQMPGLEDLLQRRAGLARCLEGNWTWLLTILMQRPDVLAIIEDATQHPERLVQGRQRPRQIGGGQQTAFREVPSPGSARPGPDTN